MPKGWVDNRELKQKLRKLKQLEITLRFGQSGPTKIINGFVSNHMSKQSDYPSDLVWYEFFELHEVSKRAVKYPMSRLITMDKEAYKLAVEEYLIHVYYRIYKEQGHLTDKQYPPELLKQLDLPYDADSIMVKKRFRELVKLSHPDAGGDKDEFIRLVELFKKLCE